MITFVQVCNSAYGPQGLALYRSLEKHMSGDWRMLWYCLDDHLHDSLLGGHRLVAVRAWDANRTGIDDYQKVDEVPGLLGALDQRKGGSWFWTWAAQATHHAIEQNPGDTVVYLDTDVWITSDPMPAIREVLDAGADVGLLDHRWPKHKAERVKRGDWWVGWNVFAPTIRARACAAWWAAWVRARCESDDPGDEYLDIPAGLCGDQPPLSAFERIARVHKIMTPGILSSWNWDGYVYEFKDEEFRVWENGERGSFGGTWPVIAVHWHEFRFDRQGNCTKKTGYETPGAVQEYLVQPYEAAVQAAAKELGAA